jgi:BRCA1-associated protein
MGPGPADALAADKVEAIGIEYSYLLTSQLDSQRAYFEQEKSVLEVALRDAHERLALFESRVARLDVADAASKKLEAKAQRAEVRAERAVELTRKLEKELGEEKALSTGLMARISCLNSELRKAEEERFAFGRTLEEMQDQLRDMMIYIEARDKIQNEAIQGSGDGTSSVLGEAVGGAISLPAPNNESPQSMKRSRRKKG